MTDKPKPSEELANPHDALIAKMDALVGRHRASASADPDDIPLLTDVVSAKSATPAPDTSARATTPPAGAPATVAPGDLLALLETHLATALSQQMAEQLNLQLQAHLASAIREVLERESKHIAQRVAARVSELLRERGNGAR